ncbi:MAG TPA: hypothetical protein VEJ23_04005 [Solirubrobacteraceae bacterium]|nr:hypothetical protein [Solirubrobacteraceae bacterium]
MTLNTNLTCPENGLIVGATVNEDKANRNGGAGIDAVSLNNTTATVASTIENSRADENGTSTTLGILPFSGILVEVSGPTTVSEDEASNNGLSTNTGPPTGSGSLMRPTRG